VIIIEEARKKREAEFPDPEDDSSSSLVRLVRDADKGGKSDKGKGSKEKGGHCRECCGCAGSGGGSESGSGRKRHHSGAGSGVSRFTRPPKVVVVTEQGPTIIQGAALPPGAKVVNQPGGQQVVIFEQSRRKRAIRKKFRKQLEP